MSTFTFASASSELRHLLQACDAHALTPWETEFVGSMQSRRSAPTDKQMARLRRIAAGAPNYEAIATAALRALPDIVSRWLPDGKQTGHEYVARNPKRADRTPGSFCINTQNGKWADFASGDRGGDVISLAAWLFDLTQPEAARRIASMLGIDLELAHG